VINSGMHATTIYFLSLFVIFAHTHATGISRNWSVPSSWTSRGNVMSACSTTSHLSIPACQKKAKGSTVGPSLSLAADRISWRPLAPPLARDISASLSCKLITRTRQNGTSGRQ
jgi:hypothetical protein